MHAKINNWSSYSDLYDPALGLDEEIFMRGCEESHDCIFSTVVAVEFATYSS